MKKKILLIVSLITLLIIAIFSNRIPISIAAASRTNGTWNTTTKNIGDKTNGFSINASDIPNPGDIATQEKKYTIKAGEEVTFGPTALTLNKNVFCIQAGTNWTTNQKFKISNKITTENTELAYILAHSKTIKATKPFTGSNYLTLSGHFSSASQVALWYSRNKIISPHSKDEAKKEGMKLWADANTFASYRFGFYQITGMTASSAPTVVPTESSYRVGPYKIKYKTATNNKMRRSVKDANGNKAWYDLATNKRFGGIVSLKLTADTSTQKDKELTLRNRLLY